MASLLGVKVGMTQIIDAIGDVTPVTIIKAGPCFVTQIKTVKTDGYDAIQMGFGEAKEKRLSKGQLGHLGLLKPSKTRTQRKKNAGFSAVRYLREFRTDKPSDFKMGQSLTVEQFAVGTRVDVVGKSKGRGFAGVVKRHGFAGGPTTHGQSDRLRRPGSIGSTSGVAHVFKGKKMGGRMGNTRFTSQNLEVIRIDAVRHLIAVKGSVPGPKGGLVFVQTAVKG